MSNEKLEYIEISFDDYNKLLKNELMIDLYGYLYDLSIAMFKKGYYCNKRNNCISELQYSYKYKIPLKFQDFKDLKLEQGIEIKEMIYIPNKKSGITEKDIIVSLIQEKINN